MAETKKLKFVRPRGYGATMFATGAVADVPEPWASRFLADGTAEPVAEKPKAEKKSAAKAKSKKK